MSEDLPEALPGALSGALPGVLPDAGEETVYGLLRLAGMDVALPLAALREVVPCPAVLAGLPVAAPGLLGAMELRDLVLPVVDLRSLIDLPAARDADQVVVVVASGGQLLGLLVDEVVEVTRLRASALLAMTTASARGAGTVLSHTFREPGAGGVVSVLDAAVLLSLPGVPTVEDVTSGATAISGAADGVSRRGAGRTVTLVQCGPHRLALDVARVHTTLPSSAARPSVLDGALCRGVLDFADREVPVVDPLALLGFEPLAAEDTGAGLVLDLGHGYVVLALSELLQLVELPVEDVLPVPAFAVPRAELLVGMADLEGTGPCLVLDEDALLSAPELVALASVNTAVGAEPVVATTAATEVGGGAVVSGESYLTYAAGVDLATPLQHVAEILPVPTTITDTGVGGAVRGVVVHRRASVPVLCLAQILGRTPAPVTAASCLLLVAVDGGSVAFAVDGLRGIDPLTWCDPEQVPGPTPADLTRVLHTSRLVQVGEQTRLLPDLDLRALARAVQGPVPGAHPAPEGTAPEGTAPEEPVPAGALV
ncbi:chemotaxis protein CheW [Quadrisphaera sp. DSM 44207]|uniref:chemotaxis protein CheW n=1 Tax=Quadrisphaera sp. DSM 44207 TaxID=1881057 RepID=UPI00088C6737|nr:chemotaxis protein CheW [Quadrisphaera sp. DSM 44207]SDQ09194.1 purine-binding chemotaxis protein CheW [Quadrisphaera sp. DSM 44207]